MLRYLLLLFVILFLFLAPLALATDDEPLGPLSAKSTEELLKELRARVPKLLGAQPPLSTKELNRKDRRLLVAWYCPTSGEATCRVQTYQFDSEKKEWLRVREQYFRGTHDVTPTLDDDARLILRDFREKEIFHEPKS